MWTNFSRLYYELFIYFLIVQLQIVEWLNEATISSSESVKLTNLAKVQEILLNKDTHLLDLYLDETIQFSLDRNAEVRKLITGFIEEAG